MPECRLSEELTGRLTELFVWTASLYFEAAEAEGKGERPEPRQRALHSAAVVLSNALSGEGGARRAPEAPCGRSGLLADGLEDAADLAGLEGKGDLTTALRREAARITALNRRCRS